MTLLRWSRTGACAVNQNGRLLSAMVACLALLTHARAAPGRAATNWWDQRWPCRMRLVLPASRATVGAVPVVVPGKTILAGSGRTHLPVSALRVVVAGRELPCQVDERDGTARWVAEPNHRLDADDELVFQLDLTGGRTPDVHVYFSDTPTPVPDYPTHVFFQRASRWYARAPSHAILRNKTLWLGLAGPKSLEATRNAFANHGSGSLKQLRLRRTDLIRPGASWAWVFPRHPFACGPSVHDWSVPTCVVSGPVRKIARMSVTGFEGKDRKGQVVIQADVEHTFSLYSRGLAFDFEEQVRYRRVPARWRIQLNGTVRLAPKLHQGVAWWAQCPGRDVVKGLGPGEIEKAQKRYVGMQPDEPEEAGWAAWFDAEAAMGLACMLGRVTCSDANAQRKLRCVGLYGHNNLAVVPILTVRGASKPGTLAWCQRYVVLERTTPQQVRAHYELWQRAVKTGPVETRP